MSITTLRELQRHSLYITKIYIISRIDHDSFDDAFRCRVETKFSELEKDCSELKGEIPGGPFTTDELLPIIRNLKRRKAPGPDQITYEHIIFGGELAAQVVVKLFNEIVLQGRIPYSWKKGFIVPLFKGADKPKTSCNSLRPVALLSGFRKIF